MAKIGSSRHRHGPCCVLLMVSSVRFPGRALAIFGAALWAAFAAGADPFGHEIPMTLHDSGNYYVTGQFETGARTQMLVDTGSGLVALSGKTFKPLKGLASTQFVRRANATLANGRRTQLKIYRIARLALGEECLLHDIEIAVMPGTSVDILGLAALRHVQPFALSLDPPVLSVSNCEALNPAE